MAELFTVRLDVGPNAPIATVTTAVTDLQVITEQALVLASRHAENEARSFVSELAQESPRSLLSMLEEQELLRPDSPRAVHYLEDWLFTLEELRHFELGNPRRLFLNLGALPYAGLQAPWAQAIEQLVAVETADRLPRHGCRVRSLTYANPVTAEIIAASGATAAALALLLRTIADLPSYIERQRAVTRDVQDQVNRRMQLRALLMRRIAQGEIQLRPEDISAAFLDGLMSSADRLADQGTSFEQLNIDFAFPGSGGPS